MSSEAHPIDVQSTDEPADGSSAPGVVIPAGSSVEMGAVATEDDGMLLSGEGIRKERGRNWSLSSVYSKERIKQIFVACLFLGLVTFGGPQAHIELLPDKFVVKYP